MGRLLTPKNKLARREGIDLSLKTFGSKAHASLLRRLTIIPGYKPVRKFTSKMSDYGRQLREKQKVKRIYNITEGKMARYFEAAVKRKGDTTQFLIESLESRLDNVMYRLHLTPTRNAARQLVAHGHVLVNGKKIDVPSYTVQLNDVVTFRDAAIQESPAIKAVIEEKSYTLPAWLKRTGVVGAVVGVISMDEYKEPVNIASVIEFYSKL